MNIRAEGAEIALKFVESVEMAEHLRKNGMKIWGTISIIAASRASLEKKLPP